MSVGAFISPFYCFLKLGFLCVHLRKTCKAEVSLVLKDPKMVLFGTLLKSEDKNTSH